MEMNRWANTVKKVVKEEEKRGGGRGREKRKNINLAIVSANNHYAGFGPGTANIFRKMIGLSEATWEDKSQLSDSLHQHHSNQSAISDFMG